MNAPVLWLVVGECGEYSDRSVWTVAAYRDRAKAEAHVAAANAWCLEFLVKSETSEDYMDVEAFPCPVDRVRDTWKAPDYATRERGGDYSLKSITLHADVSAYVATEAVALDWLRENGWAP